MDSTGDDFERRLADAWPVSAWQDVTVLVAVSGGADSVALLRALTALQPSGPGRLIAAHCNHRLRGAESEADAAFVADLCHALDVPCEIGIAEPTDRGDGLEAAARDARYAFLTAAASRHGARYLAVAHTADDQAETILHRLLRGTGLAGLAGIPRLRPLTELTTLVRPLLWARRSDVLAYLSRQGQNHREDASNAQRLYTRNRVRLDLLPQLAREYNPAVVEALLRLGQLSGEAQEVLGPLATELREAAATHLPGGGWEIELTRLANQPRYLIREMFIQLWQLSDWPRQSMGLAEWDSLAEIAAAPTGSSKLYLPGNVEVVRAADDATLIIHCAKR